MQLLSTRVADAHPRYVQIHMNKVEYLNITKYRALN